MCEICHSFICPDSCPNSTERDRYCPVCDEKSPFYLFLNQENEVVGCENCIDKVDSEDYFREKEEEDWDL